MIKYLLLSLLILCWTLNPFLKKKVTKILTPMEYMFINTFSINILMIFIFLYRLLAKIIFKH